MEITNDNILEIWEIFVENMQAARRNDVALRFINWLVDNDVELESLEELRGQDEHLDFAIDQLQMENNEEEYDDNEEFEDYEE